MTWVWLIGGLVVLVAGGELLVQNASAFALKARVSPLIVGLTIVAMGTSAPELFASLQAAWNGDGSIAIGNVLGSNVANLGLALGLTAMVAPVAIAWRDLKLHWWVMVAASVAFMVFVSDLTLSRIEGVMLLAGAALYLGGQILASRRTGSDANVEDDAFVAELLEETGDASRPYPVLLGLIAVGCVGLFWGSKAFVHGATECAVGLGISTPARNQLRALSSFWRMKWNQAPAQNTKAKASKAAATMSPASATHGASRPAEAKYFWNWAKRSRPTHRKWAPPTILSTTFSNQNSAQ